MKFTLSFKIVFLSVFVSSQAMGMEEEKPTEFLFAAISHYEEQNYPQAAKIFKRYAGKPVPIAEPFCLDLANKGLLDPFQPIPCNEESGEEKKASVYFEAAQRFPTLQMKSATALEKECRLARNAENGPLLYLIGTIYEKGTTKIKADQKKAQDIFIEAMQKKEIRGFFGLSRVATSEFCNNIKIEKHSVSKIISTFSLMPKLTMDEGQICASLSGYFNNSPEKSTFFLKCAAQFGHPDAQFEWGKTHCQNESQGLYWMMQCAESENFKALGICGYLLEHGKGTNINEKKSLGYYKRAAHHPQANSQDFVNLGAMHENGKGTPQDYQIACQWYEKAYELGLDDHAFISGYGRALLEVGEDKKALPLLCKVRNFSDDAASNYASALYNLNSGTDDLTEVIDIWSKLAAKKHLSSAFNLVIIINDDKINVHYNKLKEYKDYLENAILQEEKTGGSIDLIAKSYIALRDLCLKDKGLFEFDNICIADLSGKAFQINPKNQSYEYSYACDLKDSGRYEEALVHFLKLETLGYPVVWNSIGYCYDLISKEIQISNPDKSTELGEKALVYYLKQIKAEDNSQYKTYAAFNIYALSVQKRINPLPDAEIVHFIQMAGDGGDGDAINDLGVAFMNGWLGLDQDEEKAEQLFRQAIFQDNETAKLNLMSSLFRKESEAAIIERQQLYKELWEKDSEKFKLFLEKIISFFERMLKEDSEEEDSSLLEQKDEQKEETKPLNSLKKESKEPEQQPIKPSRKEKEKLEEKERLQRKYARMSAKVEELRSKKQTKYRKIQTLLNQHIQAYGGGLKNAKGSGRRIEMGGTHSGFHQPHKADIKGGALDSLTNVMQKSSQK